MDFNLRLKSSLVSSCLVLVLSCVLSFDRPSDFTTLQAVENGEETGSSPTTVSSTIKIAGQP
jgi:hypothetical protein